jgi:hypothetical protein
VGNTASSPLLQCSSATCGCGFHNMMTYTCHKLFSRAVSHSTLAITDILLIHVYIHVWRLFSPTASIYLKTFILPNFAIHRDLFFIQPKTLRWLLNCCAVSIDIYLTIQLLLRFCIESCTCEREGNILPFAWCLAIWACIIRQLWAGMFVPLGLKLCIAKWMDPYRGQQTASCESMCTYETLLLYQEGGGLHHVTYLALFLSHTHTRARASQGELVPICWVWWTLYKFPHSSWMAVL